MAKSSLRLTRRAGVYCRTSKGRGGSHSCTVQLSARNAESLRAVLRTVDTPTRAKLLGDLQAAGGNRFVQRLLADEPSIAIQRWPVSLPPTAGCVRVVNWLNAHSPYRPMWAKTRARFRHSEDRKVEGSRPDYTVTVENASVTMTKRVDMPQWSPTGAMQTPWSNMYTALRAHEAQHENIADSWQAILEGRLGGGFYSVTARNRAQADAKGAGKIASDWQSWLNDHSADQDSIDPYTAIIECPSP